MHGHLDLAARPGVDSAGVPLAGQFRTMLTIEPRCMPDRSGLLTLAKYYSPGYPGQAALPLNVMHRLLSVITSRDLLSWLHGCGNGGEPGAVVVPAAAAWRRRRRVRNMAEHC